jgi:hypothetical protein
VPEGASISGIAPAAARRRGLGDGTARRGGKFQRGVSSRVCRAMSRAAAGAQSLALGIGQTGPCPKIFAAPRRMQRLLEGRFRAPALHIGGLYSAHVGDALTVVPWAGACWRCSNCCSVGWSHLSVNGSDKTGSSRQFTCKHILVGSCYHQASNYVNFLN